MTNEMLATIEKITAEIVARKTVDQNDKVLVDWTDGMCPDVVHFYSATENPDPDFAGDWYYVGKAVIRQDGTLVSKELDC